MSAAKEVNELLAEWRSWSDLPPILTTKEVAAWLRCDVSHIYEQAARNAIPHSRLGQKLLFDRDKLHAWFLE